MADIKWIKITTDIFDDEKILLIESLPEADSIIVIWFKLLCLAGKMNNSGVFVMNDKIAYTDKMLATIFRRKESTVALALQTFEQFGMIDIVDNVITIPNWGKHQSLDQLENKKQYMRTYMQEYRKKQAQIADKTNGKPTCKTNSKANVSSPDKDIDKEKEIEEEGENGLPYRNHLKEVPLHDAQTCMDLWNDLKTYGIKPVIDITGTRYQALKDVLQLYGEDGYKDAIEKIRASQFLQGHNDKSWVVTFDWFLKNFARVLEGQFDDKSKLSSGEGEDEIAAAIRGFLER